MNRSVLVLLTLLTVAGIVGVLFWGVRPRPVQKIKISEMTSPTVMAQATILRLRDELKSRPVLLLGFSPTNKDLVAVADAFLAGAKEPGWSYDIVIREKELGLPPVAGIEDISIRDEFNRLSQVIGQVISEKKRMLIIVPDAYSAQAVKGQLAEALLKIYPDSIMSLSMFDFPRQREEEKERNTVPCVVAGVDDQTGTGGLGCLILQTSRATYRAKLDPSPYVGLLNQIGLRDYLLLFRAQ